MKKQQPNIPNRQTKASSVIHDLSMLSTIFSPDPENEFDNIISSIEPFDIPAEFIGCNAIVNNSSDKCFRNPFLPDDIIFFQQRFANPLFHTPRRYEEKKHLLSQILKTWKKNQSANGNPLEPFLYAMKLTDGMIGSASTSADPDPGQLEAFAKALLPYWDTTSAEDTATICHILVNWDWYQPLHVVIKMYELKSNYTNEEIDDILRNRRLYTPDYASVAFESLCAHPYPLNVEALLSFITRSRQIAIITSSEIQVTNRMRDLFHKMYDVINTELQDLIKSLYIEKYSSYTDSKSRVFLDSLLDIKGPIDSMRNHFTQYKNSTGAKKQQHFDYIVKNWNISDANHRRLCQQISDEKLLDFVKRKIQGLSSPAYGWVLYYLAQNHYVKALKFVETEFQQTTLKDRQWIACACASNCMCNNPPLLDIAEQFFIYGRGYSYKNQLHQLIRDTKKTKQFREAVLMLYHEITDKPEKWNVFIQSCIEFYCNEYVTATYPLEIDHLLKKAIAYAASENVMMIFNVLNMIENIMTRSNRDRYRDMLHEIYYEKSFSDMAHKRARKQLNKCYLE